MESSSGRGPHLLTRRRYAEFQALQGAFDRRTEETERERESADAKKRQAHELHDNVVQGLAVAKLALEVEETFANGRWKLPRDPAS